MRTIRPSERVAPGDRARDHAALLVAQVVAMFAALAPLDPPIPRLAAPARRLELAEERREIAPALLLLMVLPLARLPRELRG